jgi:hypothetical protein
VDRHDIWVEKCWCNLSESHELYFSRVDRQNCGDIYIDDVVIKSLDHESHLDDARKTLECTRKHGLKMNPNKCAFGVSAGEVHEGAIEVGKRA